MNLQKIKEIYEKQKLLLQTTSICMPLWDFPLTLTKTSRQCINDFNYQEDFLRSVSGNIPKKLLSQMRKLEREKYKLILNS